ncbi:MAG: hypothetical protein GYB33_20075 [Gammaproteobacteria bacterium]|uniref:hypothetical protein n=1 Tax=Pseudomaricurvus alcaniphilus TaxID=1166482 RepID=UPI00140D6679|nr:hypothetical protein [Pseudomaricurvus alcaniphilus]MBR9912646.1 hypothetical protein [Gammaproteobacteria bacterium]NHN35995.1 hypothetical protein [Pseudomaricurvus alcaniphilus]
MIFNKRRGMRSVMTTALLACLAFVALAIWGWKLPIAAALQYLVICLLMVVVLIAAAALVVGLFKFVQRLCRRR